MKTRLERRAHASKGPAFFFAGLLAMAAILGSCSGIDAIAQEAARPAGQIEIVRNADGSVTIPAGEIEKMAEYFGRLEGQNEALKRALERAAQQIDAIAKRRCA